VPTSIKPGALEALSENGGHAAQSAELLVG
jgi:hypothetical protein